MALSLPVCLRIIARPDSVRHALQDSFARSFSGRQQQKVLNVAVNRKLLGQSRSQADKEGHANEPNVNAGDFRRTETHERRSKNKTNISRSTLTLLCFHNEDENADVMLPTETVVILEFQRSVAGRRGCGTHRVVTRVLRVLQASHRL